MLVSTKLTFCRYTHLKSAWNGNGIFLPIVTYIQVSIDIMAAFLYWENAPNILMTHPVLAIKVSMSG